MTTASDPYDSLAKLLRAERNLRAAGARGEAVGEELQEVRNSIRAILDQRAEQAYQQTHGRSR